MRSTAATRAEPLMTTIEIPADFEPHFRKSPFTDPWEPLYSKRTERGVTIGLRLASAHTNSRGLIHGGLIASLADNAMGYSCAQVMGWTASLLTVSLAVDYIGSAICFAQGLIRADGAVIARASGTCRVGPKKP